MIETIFHGHSCVEIKTDAIRVFIDPYMSWNPQSDITVEECLTENLDAIILTHGHADHVWDTIELANKTNCLVIATFEVEQRLISQWVMNTSSQHIGWEVAYEWFAVKYTSALHWWAITNSWLWWVAAWVLVRVWWRTIYHAWDTGLSMEMKLIWEREDIHTAFLPIWDRYTMWVNDAVRASEMIWAKYVVPIHYNTRPLITADPMEFSRCVMLQWVSIPKVLKPWQHLIIEA